MNLFERKTDSDKLIQESADKLLEKALEIEDAYEPMFLEGFSRFNCGKVIDEMCKKKKAGTKTTVEDVAKELGFKLSDGEMNWIKTKV